MPAFVTYFQVATLWLLGGGGGGVAEAKCGDTLSNVSPYASRGTGHPVRLGALWNVHHKADESPVVMGSLFAQDVLAQSPRNTDVRDAWREETKIELVESASDVASMSGFGLALQLQMGSELKLNLGIETATSRLQQRNTKVMVVLINILTRTYFFKEPLYTLPPDPYNANVFNGLATHVVTQVTYGKRLMLIMSYATETDEQADQMTFDLELEIKSGGFGLNLELDTSKVDELKKKFVSVNFDMESTDPDVAFSGFGFADAIKVIKSFYESTKPGVPMLITLEPLCQWTNNPVGQLLKIIGDEFLLRAVQANDDLNTALALAKQYADLAQSLGLEQSRLELEDVAAQVLKFQLTFQIRLLEILPNIRKSLENQQSLMETVERIVDSPFYGPVLLYWLEMKYSELEWWASFKADVESIRASPGGPPLVEIQTGKSAINDYVNKVELDTNACAVATLFVVFRNDASKMFSQTLRSYNANPLPGAGVSLSSWVPWYEMDFNVVNLRNSREMILRWARQWVVDREPFVSQCELGQVPKFAVFPVEDKSVFQGPEWVQGPPYRTELVVRLARRPHARVRDVHECPWVNDKRDRYFSCSLDWHEVSEGQSCQFDDACRAGCPRSPLYPGDGSTTCGPFRCHFPNPTDLFGKCAFSCYPPSQTACEVVRPYDKPLCGPALVEFRKAEFQRAWEAYSGELLKTDEAVFSGGPRALTFKWFPVNTTQCLAAAGENLMVSQEDCTMITGSNPLSPVLEGDFTWETNGPLTSSKSSREGIRRIRITKKTTAAASCVGRTPRTCLVHDVCPNGKSVVPNEFTRQPTTTPTVLAKTLIQALRSEWDDTPVPVTTKNVTTYVPRGWITVSVYVNASDCSVLSAAEAFTRRGVAELMDCCAPLHPRLKSRATSMCLTASVGHANYSLDDLSSLRMMPCGVLNVNTTGTGGVVDVTATELLARQSFYLMNGALRSSFVDRCVLFDATTYKVDLQPCKDSNLDPNMQVLCDISTSRNIASVYILDQATGVRGAFPIYDNDGARLRGQSLDLQRADYLSRLQAWFYRPLDGTKSFEVEITDVIHVVTCDFSAHDSVKYVFVGASQVNMTDRVRVRNVTTREFISNPSREYLYQHEETVKSLRFPDPTSDTQTLPQDGGKVDTLSFVMYHGPDNTVPAYLRLSCTSSDPTSPWNFDAPSSSMRWIPLVHNTDYTFVSPPDPSVPFALTRTLFTKPTYTVNTANIVFIADEARDSGLAVPPPDVFNSSSGARVGLIRSPLPSLSTASPTKSPSVLPTWVSVFRVEWTRPTLVRPDPWVSVQCESSAMRQARVDKIEVDPTSWDFGMGSTDSSTRWRYRLTRDGGDVPATPAGKTNELWGEGRKFQNSGFVRYEPIALPNLAFQMLDARLGDKLRENALEAAHALMRTSSAACDEATSRENPYQPISGDATFRFQSVDDDQVVYRALRTQQSRISANWACGCADYDGCAGNPCEGATPICVDVFAGGPGEHFCKPVAESAITNFADLIVSGRSRRRAEATMWVERRSLQSIAAQGPNMACELVGCDLDPIKDVYCANIPNSRFPNQTDGRECIPRTRCGKGTYQNVSPNSTSDRTCVTCPEGTYQNVSGVGWGSSCKNHTALNCVVWKIKQTASSDGECLEPCAEGYEVQLPKQDADLWGPRCVLSSTNSDLCASQCKLVLGTVMPVLFYVMVMVAFIPSWAWCRGKGDSYGKGATKGWLGVRDACRGASVNARAWCGRFKCYKRFFAAPENGGAAKDNDVKAATNDAPPSTPVESQALSDSARRDVERGGGVVVGTDHRFRGDGGDAGGQPWTTLDVDALFISMTAREALVHLCDKETDFKPFQVRFSMKLKLNRMYNLGVDARSDLVLPFLFGVAVRHVNVMVSDHVLYVMHGNRGYTGVVTQADHPDSARELDAMFDSSAKQAEAVHKFKSANLPLNMKEGSGKFAMTLPNNHQQPTVVFMVLRACPDGSRRRAVVMKLKLGRAAAAAAGAAQQGA